MTTTTTEMAALVTVACVDATGERSGAMSVAVVDHMAGAIRKERLARAARERRLSEECHRQVRAILAKSQ